MLKTKFIILLIAIFLSNLSISQNLKMKEEQAIKVYRDFYHYKLTANINGLDKILSDDFTLTHMTGKVQSKAEWMKDIKEGKMKYISAKEDFLVVKIEEDKGEIISKNQVKAVIYGFSGIWGLELKMQIFLDNEKWKIGKTLASSY